MEEFNLLIEVNKIRLLSCDVLMNFFLKEMISGHRIFHSAVVLFLVIGGIFDFFFSFIDVFEIFTTHEELFEGGINVILP
jgi:hypothetical protein